MQRVGLALFAISVASSTALADHHHRHHGAAPPPPAPTPAPVPAPVPEPSPEPLPPPEESPWAKGITDEQKAAANDLLSQGNDLFVQNKYKDALARYTDAIAVWDHPAIRFNMVRALIALDRPLDAYDNLQKALAYGKAPLEDQVYTEALNYQTLLEGQIANLDVTCKQDGVDVSVDGQSFLTCPGAKNERVLPGHHVVVGKKHGFLTFTKDAVLLAKVDQPIDVKLESLQEAAVTRTRWSVWKPWAVAGAGAFVAGLGGIVDWNASKSLSDFNTQVNGQCMDTGCGSMSGLSIATQDRALLENKIAIGVMAVGGAALATGVVLVIMNRPHTYVPEESTVVTPMVTPGGAGASLTLHY